MNRICVLNSSKKVHLSTRNGFIELCRFIFAMCIVSHHFLLLPTQSEHYPLIGGYIGVEFFFILSGYFLYAAAINDVSDQVSVIQVVKRLKKIFPYFVVSWFFGFTISIARTHCNILRVCWNLIVGIPQLLLLSMTGMANREGAANDYVGTGWYLSALMLAMLIAYPVMHYFRKRFAGLWAPLFAIFVYGYFMIVNNNVGVVNQHTICYLGVLRALAGLSMGSFCYWIAQTIQLQYGGSLSKFGDIIISVIQIILVTLSLILMEWYIGHNDTLQIILFSCLIVLSMSFDTSVNRFFTNSTSLFLGRFSIAIFLSQSMTYMYGILQYPDDWRLRYITHIGYVLVASVIVYFSVEMLKHFSIGQKIRHLMFKK